MLGYSFGQATVRSRFGRVSSTFRMDDVRCTGYEASLLDCRHETKDDCGSDEGAGVICSNRNVKGPVVMLRRKRVGNPVGYFDKTFAEYKRGFESRGELWLGLEKLHQLTSKGSYSLRITMKDFDDKTYVAVYDQFQVGPGDDYVLTLEGFNDYLSTLGDSMTETSVSGANNLNGMRFSTRDRDQDGLRGRNCAELYSGGWWYNFCTAAHLTGQHTRSRVNSLKKIVYFDGGERGIDSYDSWSEAEMLLLPN